MNIPTAAPGGDQLIWWPEAGMGFYPVVPGPEPYDLAYWERYEGYDASPLGHRLTGARIEMVNRWWTGPLIDVGIGAGGFLKARSGFAPTFGADVNPHAIAYLESRGLRRDPEADNGRIALSFWDCLEHIHEPDAMLARALFVFVSLPLFTGPEHVLRSRHFRRDEHCWYWTREGLLQWFAARGFQCQEHNTAESLLGREDIHSFAFRRFEP
jgi:hypothetical protein